MKDSKTILRGYLIFTLALHTLIVLLIALPTLDTYRSKISDLSGLPSSAFWIPLLGLLLLTNFFVFRRLGVEFVEPFRELLNQTKLGSSTIAFKKKSMNSEEDHLKHFIESLTLRSADLEQEVAHMEAEVERIGALANTSPQEIEALNAKLKAAAAENEAFASKLASEQSNAATLQKEILSLRRELKQRNRQLETLQGEAKPQTDSTETAPLSSILVERLKTPLNLINNLAWRLSKSWDETPPAKIREGLDEISKHSEEQLELLKRFENGSSGKTEREAL